MLKLDLFYNTYRIIYLCFIAKIERKPLLTVVNLRDKLNPKDQGAMKGVIDVEKIKPNLKFGADRRLEFSKGTF